MCMAITTKFIDPFTDFGFKKIFGTEENKALLMSFLNDLLDIEHEIIDLEYNNLERLGLKVLDRQVVYDVFCTDTKGRKFIVELQRCKQRYFKDRSIYYTTFPIQEQALKGDWDYRLNEVYFVGILDFEFDKTRPDEYLTKATLKDQDNNEFYHKLTYYYLEMPKFRKSEKELATHLDYWLFYLNNLQELVRVPEKLKQDAVINEAFDIAEFLAMSPDDQLTYRHDRKARWDNKNALDYLEEESIKKGLEQGLEKGIQEGIEAGEYRKAIEIAKKLLDVLDSKTIALKTGLAITEIEKLRK